MAKFVICGQAPSRSGDGRAFTGPSGKRLSLLLRLSSYEEMAAQVTLANIFSVPAVAKPLPARRRNKPPYPRRAPGDEFDQATGAIRGQSMMLDWARDPELVVVLACGKGVFKALTGEEGEFFKGKAFKSGPARGVDVWCFPHPSGASMFWNTPENHQHARDFLRRLLKRYGIKLQ